MCLGEIELGQIYGSRDEDLRHFQIAQTDVNLGVVSDCRVITQ